MKITPLEIRKQTFEKQIRGFDKEEVNAFLLSLSHEWERAVEQIKTLESQLKKSEEDVVKLREVEASLYKTLKTAEDTGANMIDQAKRAADLHLKETQMTADALLNESKSRARGIIDDADLNSKQILDSMDNEIKDLARVYSMLEDHRDDVLNELTNLSTITLQRVQKVSDNLKHFDLEKKLKEVKEKTLRAEKLAPLNKKTNNTTKSVTKKVTPATPEIEPKEDIIKEPETPELSKDDSSSNSFFDELD
jgi:cell division initiation protein